VIIAFHVSIHGTLRLLHSPYTLALDSRVKQLTDLLVIDCDGSRTDISIEEPAPVLLAVAGDGSLWSTPLLDSRGEGNDSLLRIVWDAKLQAQAANGPAMQGGNFASGINDKAETKHTIIDARWAWLGGSSLQDRAKLH
jgi:hypothetical protein